MRALWLHPCLIGLFAGCPLVTSCLLVTSPINTAPQVTILAPDNNSIVREKTAIFTAKAEDKNQDIKTLKYSWYRSTTCSEALSDREKPELSGIGQTYFSFIPDSLKGGCIALIVTDNEGATHTATHPFEVLNQPPTATIEILPTTEQNIPVKGQPYVLSLFDQLLLSGSQSKDLDNEDNQLLTYYWRIYASDETQRALDACPQKQNQEVCTFKMEVPGDYRIELVVVDPYHLESEAATQTISVSTDTPPNIASYSPQTLSFPQYSREPTNLAVIKVEDDGDPFPPSPQFPAGFIWYWRNFVIGGSAEFTRLPWATQASLTIPGYTFQSGDTIQYRLEYHDRVTANSPLPCDTGLLTCQIGNNRRQWITWTVSYQ
jgi:hypothetical protein